MSYVKAVVTTEKRNCGASGFRKTPQAPLQLTAIEMIDMGTAPSRMDNTCLVVKTLRASNTATFRPFYNENE